MPLVGPGHTSETTAQLQYEQDIYDKQHSETPLDSTDDITTDMENKARISGGNGNDGSDNGKPETPQQQRPGFRERIKNMVKDAFPEAITDVKIMGGMAALESRVAREMQDPKLFPEIERVAHVRRGVELCPEELTFLDRRKVRARDNLARYLGLQPEDVDPRDVPTVAFGGSGGGFRAMIGCLGYCRQMQHAGLWDCLTYVSGVSGSCWSLAAYYTFGHTSFDRVIDHCKQRFSPHHPLSGEAIRTILSSPGGARITLGPLIQKSKSGLQTVAMDLYAVFTTGWIFFQNDPATHPGRNIHGDRVAGYQRSWYRYSTAREYTDSGAEPMPIMTAIRHERPWKDWKDKEHPFDCANHAEGDHKEADEAWFQWYEMSPYEIGCDEVEAWVPTWGFGRPFKEGKSTMQLPEQSLALLLGLCTSAPAGPLTSYISTISRNLPTNFLGNSIHALANRIAKFWGKQGTEEFQEHHPLHACNEHNFMYHYTHVEPGQGRPPGLENSPRIHLIDSGMDNNCPTYVLLHPGRQADIIINMDASSDVQKDTFPERVDQIGSRRGLKFKKRHDIKPGEDPKDPNRFNGLYAQIYDGIPCERPATVVDSYGRNVTNPPAPVHERECKMIYMPLLPNAKAVPDFDPSTAKFSGSYNLVWTAEQIETLVKVCVQNFEDGQDVIKDTMRSAWLWKRDERLGRGTNGPTMPQESALSNVAVQNYAPPIAQVSTGAAQLAGTNGDATGEQMSGSGVEPRWNTAVGATIAPQTTL
ncbi:hypothetical protein LTR62_002007 [Meristemomyces frigidus]|uniref:Lysophospholipase n=1 Tax=Meristemomyces frigidus TaxID=1508187 RepID=A0AAN7TMU4_9PEZI|nr:hypothetical protein LTR62_002007 [Meristemomyces frigidus]